MDKIYQNIVVGSGPGAVMAALTLVEAGKQVLMIDAGNIDGHYDEMVPAATAFEDLRKSDKKQNRYLLGDDFEAVPQPFITTGAQLTPARRHIIKGVDEWSPVRSSDFFPMESLALGGLGAGWGLGVYVYSDAELQKAGLPVEEMKVSYNTVAGRIGISCGSDDVSPYLTGNIIKVQPPLRPDNSVALMLEKYRKKRSGFLKNRLYFGLPSMAMLTEDMDGRKATDYTDMDFYTDGRKSAWRPAFTVEKLKSFKNFTYLNGKYVLSFSEKNNEVAVYATDMKTGEKIVYKTQNLLLGAGALGTARIVMRSLNIKRLPLLCNPYTYMPAVNLAMLGKPLNKYKTSMAQAMMIYDTDGSNSDLVSVALYTYRSLLLMRLIQQSPLNIADNRKIFKWLQSAFVIAGIHHPDEYYDKKTIELVEDAASKTGDALKVKFSISPEAEIKIKEREAVIKRGLRKMGVFPIKRIDPGFGSSIHYGGTLPFSTGGKEGTTSVSGLINGLRNVYAVDGSSFAYLPAKGITFSIMANAHRIAEKLIENE